MRRLTLPLEKNLRHKTPPNAEAFPALNEITEEIEGEQFELYYQPQIEIRSGRIVGIEALIRWNHPTLGMLGPAHFIGAAEEAGLIMAIWEWVLVAALIQHNAWLAQGLPAVTIAVNLSSVQFSDPALAERVEEIAPRHAARVRDRCERTDGPVAARGCQ